MHFLYLAIAAVLAAGGAWWHGSNHGYERRDLECRAEVSLIREQLAEAERQANAVREKGRILADRAAAQAAEWKAQIATLQKRVSDEISRRASPTRRALDGDITRLLNEQSVIRESTSSDSASAAPARVAATPAGATEDRAGSEGRSASERAVATWGSKMIEYAQNCRVTLHALQDWARAITQ